MVEETKKTEELEKPLGIPEPTSPTIPELTKVRTSNLEDDLGNQFSKTQKTDLTDGGATTLHFHSVVGFTSRARVYLSADQSINANSSTKILLDTENYDGDGEFTSNRFTAVSAGYYLVVAEVALDSLDDGESLQPMIYVNGAEVCRNRAYSGGADKYLRGFVSDIVSLGAGGYVELYARHDSAEGAKDAKLGTQQTFMAIHRLS